jgi:hypothetical protein
MLAPPFNNSQGNNQYCENVVFASRVLNTCFDQDDGPLSVPASHATD